MAAPINPTSAQLNKGFYQLAIDIITVLSNLNLPASTESTATGVISGTTANTIVLCLTKQMNFY